MQTNTNEKTLITPTLTRTMLKEAGVIDRNISLYRIRSTASAIRAKQQDLL